MIHAIVALHRADPAKALEALEAATPYELGTPRCASTGFFGSLYPILLRGEAYLAARKGPEAAREFQKLLDHQGVMIGDPVSVLAHYGLARAYSLSDDAINAREQYRKFLADWKDADPDIPIFRQAKDRIWKPTVIPRICAVRACFLGGWQQAEALIQANKTRIASSGPIVADTSPM